MKRLLFAVGGFCAASVGFLVWSSLRRPPVDILAHRLEDAWADNHTIA